MPPLSLDPEAPSPSCEAVLQEPTGPPPRAGKKRGRVNATAQIRLRSRESAQPAGERPAWIVVSFFEIVKRSHASAPREAAKSTDADPRGAEDALPDRDGKFSKLFTRAWKLDLGRLHFWLYDRDRAYFFKRREGIAVRHGQESRGRGVVSPPEQPGLATAGDGTPDWDGTDSLERGSIAGAERDCPGGRDTLLQ